MSETEDFNDTTSFGNFSLTTCEACIGYTGCTCVKDPDEFHPSNVPYIKVTLATHFICIIFGTVGNLITLFTMGTADRKNKTGTNIFLISLSVSYTKTQFLKIYLVSYSNTLFESLPQKLHLCDFMSAKVNESCEKSQNKRSV